ncbi:MAG TPA: sugar ABC transporter substrate-binding protein [Mycobacteriales bacterium]|nr:sugar ABC transporter substrate-binding protein [Mycobacteriales bacterium]
MRRTLAMVCALPLIALSACSGGAEPAGRRDPGAALTGSIRVQLSGGDSEIKAAQELVDSFQASHPGATVTLIPVASQGDHIAKLATAFAAGKPPDVFLINYRRFGTFARPEVIDPPDPAAAAGLYPAPVAAFTKDGRLLCLPQNASSMVVYFNPAMFAKAGVDVPKQGWTWSDMLATARALQAKGVEAVGFETELIRLAPFVWSNGSEIVDKESDPSKVTLDAPPAREALQFLLDLQKTGLDATQRAAQEPEEAFLAGRTAMLFESRRAVPSLRKAPDLEFDVVGVPRKVSATSVLHSDGYCVAAKSKNKALGQAFAAYAVSTEGATVLARTGRTVPSVQALAESPVFLDPTVEPKSAQVFLDALPTVRAMPSSPGWHEAEETAGEILTALFAGNLSLDAAVRRIEKDTATVLAQRR